MIKKTKIGFTLAEGLVVLGIIGVIAAITIPPVMDGFEKGKTAAILGRSAQIIESGCQKLITAANANSADGIADGYSALTQDDLYNNGNNNSINSNNALLNSAASFFGVSNLTNNGRSYASQLKEYNGSSSSSFNNAHFSAHEKLGAYIGVLNVPAAAIGGNDLNPITDLIIIDTNGTSVPNRYGMDVFAFGLTDKCNLIPAGTEKMKSLASSFSAAGSAFNKTASEGCNPNSISSGLSCTAKIVQDGFKIKY